MAPWIPEMSVPTSFATVAIDTFITELSRIIRNWAAHNVIRPALLAVRVAVELGGAKRLGDVVHRCGLVLLHAALRLGNVVGHAEDQEIFTLALATLFR